MSHVILNDAICDSEYNILSVNAYLNVGLCGRG